MELLKDSRKKEWFWIENSLIDNLGLSTYEKMIYIVLVRHLDYESTCFPSKLTISKKSGCSIATVKRVINSLEEKELIKKVNRKNENGNNESNLYYIASLNGGLCENLGSERTPKKTYNKKTYIKSNTTPQSELKTDYLDLTFLDLDIEKVKLTKEEYDKLISKFGKKYIHDKIVSLENYIVNGKGSRYKSHYRALLTWGNGDVGKGIVPEVTKAKNPLSGFKEL